MIDVLMWAVRLGQCAFFFSVGFLVEFQEVGYDDYCG